MRAIELFPCSGGMAEGFRRAGITFDWAFDIDPDACDSYEQNLEHRPVCMDVRDLARMVREGWRPREIDLLVADPPCTPWSRAGKRKGLADERDMLRETAELISLLKPRAYLIGNVPGLQDATTWHVVQEVIGGLAEDGYCVADYVQLDAAAYGVPQHRVRPFWFGHRDGPCIRWPSPTHGPAGQLQIPGCELAPYVTCRDALQHLPLEQLGRPVRMRVRAAGEADPKDGGDASRCSSPDRPASTVVAAPQRKGGQILLSARHPPASPASPAPTIGAKDRGQGTVLLAERKPDANRPPADADADAPHRTVTGTGRGHNHLLSWPWDRPATTLWRDDRLTPPGHHETSCLSGSDTNAVILSERAASILQGFREDWVFSGETKKARWSQIGMAMPPPLAEAVARSIVAQMAVASQEAA